MTTITVKTLWSVETPHGFVDIDLDRVVSHTHEDGESFATSLVKRALYGMCVDAYAGEAKKLTKEGKSEAEIAKHCLTMAQSRLDSVMAGRWKKTREGGGTRTSDPLKQEINRLLRDTAMRKLSATEKKDAESVKAMVEKLRRNAMIFAAIESQAKSNLALAGMDLADLVEDEDDEDQAEAA